MREHWAQQRAVFFLHTLHFIWSPPTQPRLSRMRSVAWLAMALVGEVKGERAPGVKNGRGALGVAGGPASSMVLVMPS